jgi:hypothetical protein
VKRKPNPLGGMIETPGAGGGRAAPPARTVDRIGQRENYIKNQVEQSITDRGGYPTRGGQPLKTKMQERMEQRQANQPPIDEAARAARKKKFGIGFSKGGMVKGQCRDYGKG